MHNTISWFVIVAFAVLIALAILAVIVGAVVALVVILTKSSKKKKTVPMTTDTDIATDATVNNTAEENGDAENQIPVDSTDTRTTEQ